MTSNIGSQFLDRRHRRGDRRGAGRSGALREHFRPEFLNRVDEIVVFRRLDREQLGAIVDLQVGRLRQRLAERGIALEITEAPATCSAGRATTRPTAPGRSSGWCSGASRTRWPSGCWPARSATATGWWSGADGDELTFRVADREVAPV